MKDSWTAKYIGKPWRVNPNPPQSFNCGELVRYVYKHELGIFSPPLIADVNKVRECIRDIRSLKRYANFVQVFDKEAFDVAVFDMRGLSMHIGLYVPDDLVMHADEEAGCVVIDDVAAIKSLGYDIKWYRIKK